MVIFRYPCSNPVCLTHIDISHGCHPDYDAGFHPRGQCCLGGAKIEDNDDDDDDDDDHDHDHDGDVELDDACVGLMMSLLVIRAMVMIVTFLFWIQGL